MPNIMEILLKAAGGDQVKTEIGKVSGSASDLDKLFRKLGDYLTVGALMKGIQMSIQEFEKQERAIIKLNSALRSHNVVGDEVSKGFLKQATDLSNLTEFTDDAITAAQAYALTLGVSADTVKQMTPLVLDFAAATGTDLTNAFFLVGKASMGMTEQLRRHGIFIDENEIKVKGFNAVMEKLEKNYGGTAKAIKDGVLGPSIQFRQNLGEIGEEIGAVTLPELNKLTKALNDVFKQFGGTEQNKATENYLKFLREISKERSKEERLKVINEEQKLIENVTKAQKKYNLEFWNLSENKNNLIKAENKLKEYRENYLKDSEKEKAAVKSEYENSKEMVAKMRALKEEDEKKAKERKEKELQRIEEVREKEMELYMTRLNNAESLVEQTSNLAQSLYDLNITGIENEKNTSLNAAQEKYEAEKDRIEQTIADEEKKKELMQSLETSYQAEVENIKTKADNEARKRREELKPILIAEASANTALGATKALAQGGIFGIATAALVVAAGMAEVAKIQAQKFQGGGMVPGPEGAPVPAIVHGGERVLTPEQQDRMISDGKSIYLNFYINGTFVEGDEAKWDRLVREHVFAPLQRLLKKTGQQFIGG